MSKILVYRLSKLGFVSYVIQHFYAYHYLSSPTLGVLQFTLYVNNWGIFSGW